MNSRYDRKIDSEHFDQNSSQEKLLVQIKPGSKVLECGCATGYMTKYMRDELGCHVSIVEYDAEAYEIARQYADDGICADLMQAEWLDKFQGEQFDYILFADVLEHLYDPQAVLKSTVSLLKEDGNVLVSLPNVAHGDILLNLWRGNWNYTETGLLDKTHIRFFAENNLDDFFQNAGLSIVRLDYTTHPVGQTEQVFGLPGVIDSELSFLDLVSKKENITIYQFIVSAQLTEYAQRNHAKKERIAPTNETMATLYYGWGEGFSEDHTKRMYYSTPNFHQRFEWKRNFPKELRFDPVEGQACVVTAIQVLSCGGELDVVPINGYRLGHTDFFCAGDPQYSITVGDLCVEWVEIYAQIELLSNGRIQAGIAQLVQDCLRLDGMQQVQRLSIQGLQEKIQKGEEEKQALIHRYGEENQTLIQKCEEEKETLIQKYKEEKQQIVQEFVEKNQLQVLQYEEEKHELIQKCEELNQQLNRYKEHYHAAIAQRDRLGHDLAQVQYAYADISNAFFWKITKPARVVMDVLKELLKKNRYTYLFCKGLKCLKQNGFFYTWKKVKEKFQKKVLCPLANEELEKEKKVSFSINIKFSILVPLYNTSEVFLNEMVQSVIKQTYSNWELCLADGSDSRDSITEKLCKQYMAKDRRIKYIKINKNLGIAGNTLEAYKISTGDYYVLLDHDDFLSENALFEMCCCLQRNPTIDFIYSDRAVFEDRSYKILAYHFLPSFSPEFLRSCNYASHLNAFSKWVIDQVGFLRGGYDGSQDYDLELRVIESARTIVHIPKVLYYCRACDGSVAQHPENKNYAYEAGRRAIEEHIRRIGYPGTVEFLPNTFSYRIHYDLLQDAKVTILIPNKDHRDDLERCIYSIISKTRYKNYEIVVLENNSVEKDTFEFYSYLEKNLSVKVIYCPIVGFNYSAINNCGVKETTGEYILFLNNDIEVLSDGWLIEMLMYAQRKDVGAVGAKLYYPDDTNQSTGLFIGLNGHIASYYDHKKSRFEFGYMNRLSMAQNYNAVTAACMLVKRADFIAVGGFDEEQFKIGLNDIDFCLKLREMGLLNVVTPYAELYHYESKSRGSDEEGSAKERFAKEQLIFREKWKKYFESYDLYTNPNFII